MELQKSNAEQRYDAFVEEMHREYPKIFSDSYGGFCIGEGWWNIIRSLCRNIQGHIEDIAQVRERLLESNPYNHPIPEEIDQVVVRQIKEKFGGLRFYYDGGDAYIEGMVRMAEVWAGNSCEVCGNLGRPCGTGWIRTLCDTHYEE